MRYGREKLGVSGVRPATHTNASVRPWLLGCPLDRIEAILIGAPTIIVPWIEYTLRFEAPANMLRHVHETITRKQPAVVDAQRRIVRGPFDNHGISTRFARAKYTRSQDRSVPHRDRHSIIDADFVEAWCHAVTTPAACARPSSSIAISRILNFCTLPVTVIGNPSTNFQ